MNALVDPARDIVVAAWIRAQEHPTDCICNSCAPVSWPTRSPIVNDALARGANVELTQAIAMYHQLSPRRQRQTMDLMACGLRMEGKRG